LVGQNPGSLSLLARPSRVELYSSKAFAKCLSGQPGPEGRLFDFKSPFVARDVPVKFVVIGKKTQLSLGAVDNFKDVLPMVQENIGVAETEIKVRPGAFRVRHGGIAVKLRRQKFQGRPSPYPLRIGKVGGDGTDYAPPYL
jgi:hypothetical protein